jgi:ABC-type molybdate transport system permease subunit
MEQLKLPIKTSTLQLAINKARSALAYAKAHPDEIMLAVMTIMLLDIEDDLDHLEK